MKMTLVGLMVLVALTYGSPQKTPEAHNATVQKTPESGKTLAEETNLTEAACLREVAMGAGHLIVTCGA